MNEQDSFEIQRNKMKAGYSVISETKINRLKEQVLSCFDSNDMHDYLSAHFIELSSGDLIAIVTGSQKSLEFKLNLLNELSELFPHPFKKFDYSLKKTNNGYTHLPNQRI